MLKDPKIITKRKDRKRDNRRQETARLVLVVMEAVAPNLLLPRKVSLLSLRTSAAVSLAAQSHVALVAERKKRPIRLQSDLMSERRLRWDTSRLWTRSVKRVNSPAQILERARSCVIRTAIWCGNKKSADAKQRAGTLSHALQVTRGMIDYWTAEYLMEQAQGDEQDYRRSQALDMEAIGLSDFEIKAVQGASPACSALLHWKAVERILEVSFD